MPLISCPDCASGLSTEAAACPKCGRPTGAPAPRQRGDWGKAIAAVLCMVSVVGCIAGAAADSTGALLLSSVTFACGLAAFIVARLRD